MAKVTEQAATGGIVTKVNDVSKNIGSGVKSAGAKAKTHVSHNQAVYIASGAGLAAGTLTGAAPVCKKAA